MSARVRNSALCCSTATPGISRPGPISVDALFSIAEVRWALTAAIIIPQLSDAISARQLRRYALTGERFGAAEVCRIDLVHPSFRGRTLPRRARPSWRSC